MEIINSILTQLRTISLLWWIVIGAVAMLLLLFRHKREQLVGDVLIIFILTILASTVLARSPVKYTDPAELVNLDLFGAWIDRLWGNSFGRAELLLNFCMLLPVGMLFPWATKKGFLPTILFGLSLIVLIEVAQLISRRGWFELCDIVDNTIGVMIGYALYRIGEVVWRRRKC